MVGAGVWCGIFSMNHIGFTHTTASSTCTPDQCIVHCVLAGAAAAAAGDTMPSGDELSG